jgi:ferredoxin
MRIEVDPIACDAHGLCAELLPELIVLDEWGYPIIDGREVPPELAKLARRAVSRCPTLALRLESSASTGVWDDLHRAATGYGRSRGH